MITVRGRNILSVSAFPRPELGAAFLAHRKGSFLVEHDDGTFEPIFGDQIDYAYWPPLLPFGRLDERTLERIDAIAEQFVEAVQHGDAADIRFLTTGMRRQHLIGLALSITAFVSGIEIPA